MSTGEKHMLLILRRLRSSRLEGWDPGLALRDAALAAPQGEERGGVP
jgi:hypothetical protein